VCKNNINTSSIPYAVMKRLDKIVNLCQRSYPQHNLEGHLIPVVQAASELTEMYGADPTITIPGAYLHDIGRVKFDYLKIAGITHDLSGYHYARMFLKRIGYDLSTAEKISKTILTHSGHGSKYHPQTLEEEVIMNADAVAHIREYNYLLSIRYSSTGRHLIEAKEWTIHKLKDSYEHKITLPGLKQILKKEYETALIELKPHNPGISYIIVGYNLEKQLIKCIASIRNQDDEPKEIIYVDGASRDGSVNAARILGVKTYTMPKMGANHARRIGISEATQPLLIILDANTELTPGTAHEVVEKYNGGFNAGKFRWGSKQPSLRNTITDAILSIPKYKAWQGLYIDRQIAKTNPPNDSSPQINDVGDWMKSVRNQLSLTRMKSRTLENKEQFEKKGYLREIYNWLHA
jgi:HD superfamily phosphodiesterase